MLPCGEPLLRRGSPCCAALGSGQAVDAGAAVLVVVGVDAETAGAAGVVAAAGAGVVATAGVFGAAGVGVLPPVVVLAG